MISYILTAVVAGAGASLGTYIYLRPKNIKVAPSVVPVRHCKYCMKAVVASNDVMIGDDWWHDHCFKELIQF